MKHVLKASRRLKASYETLTNAPIWISDALLGETFEHFSRGCRRHGSHVPGPLEARKRLTKRKNTSIAYCGASSAPIDAAGLFSPQLCDWWKKPSENHDSRTALHPQEIIDTRNVRTQRRIESPSPNLLSWFHKPPPAPVLQNETEETRIESQKKSTLSKAGLQDRKKAFERELRKTQTLSDVRSLLQKVELDFPQKHVFTDISCTHVLKSNWGCDVLKQYMLDSTLSPPGSRTIRIMTQALFRKWLDASTQAGLFEVICQGISLGVASPEDVRYVIESTPDFYVLEKNSLVRLGDQTTIHEYYRKFLSSIDESKVISVSDLGREFMATWIEDISSRPFAPDAAHVLWRLRHHVSENMTYLATKLLTQWFNRSLQDDPQGAHDIELISFLEELPNSILPNALLRTTKCIMWDNHDKTDPIERWQKFLTTLDKNFALRVICQTAEWKNCLSKPDSRTEHAKQLLVASWIIASMSSGKEIPQQHLQNLAIGKMFKDLYSPPEVEDDQVDKSRDVLAQILGTLQMLPLPNTALLLDQMRYITDNLVVVHSPQFALRVAEHNLSGRFAVLQNHDDYVHFKESFNDALVDLAESINKNLPMFQTISRNFIQKDKLAFPTIIRVVKHNLALHNTLSQSWSQPPGRGSKLALNLMHHLAVSFATSPVITPRQALRGVYWCYITLHRYGAPIQSPIIRALWHAGVTRYNQNGRETAPTLMRWILKQVRLVEGNQVANMLLTSASFRSQMEQQFEGLSGHDEDELPKELRGDIEDMSRHFKPGNDDPVLRGK